jgi:hypothetical protein
MSAGGPGRSSSRPPGQNRVPRLADRSWRAAARSPAPGWPRHRARPHDCRRAPPAPEAASSTRRSRSGGFVALHQVRQCRLLARRLQGDLRVQRCINLPPRPLRHRPLRPLRPNTTERPSPPTNRRSQIRGPLHIVGAEAGCAEALGAEPHSSPKSCAAAAAVSRRWSRIPQHLEISQPAIAHAQHRHRCPPTAHQAGETDIFKLDGTDIYTLGLHAFAAQAP